MSVDLVIICFNRGIPPLDNANKLYIVPSFVYECLVIIPFNRGIPPLDTANTLYIEREEITGIQFVNINFLMNSFVLAFSQKGL